MFWLYIIIFIFSSFAIAWSGPKLVRSLMNIAKYMGWREFVVAFFTMSIAGSIPNLFIDINSALHGIPQLSLGDIVGGNIIDLTVAVALSVLIGRSSLPARSKMVQSSAIFTVAVSILPLILILDGKLGRIDGLILLLTFFVYMIWLFSKSDRFKKTYNHINKKERIFVRFKHFLINFFSVILALIFLLLGSEGIVISSEAFAKMLGLTLPIIGMLIVGLGNAFPETYFAIISAKKKQVWMILGDLMGSIIVCETFILGIVALISPIKIVAFHSLIIAFIFLAIAALSFLIVIRTGEKIDKKEGILLIAVYLIFLLVEAFFR